MMEGGLWYDIMAWLFLVSFGTYHIFSTTRNHYLSLLKHHIHTYSAKPYHPLLLLNTNTCNNTTDSLKKHFLRNLQLYITIACLTASIIHQLILSSEPDPLLKGRTPVHLFTSLQSATVTLLFLILSLSLLLLPPPPDLLFALASAAFYLDYSLSSSSSSFQTSDLQSECLSLSSKVSALSSLLSLLLAFFPTLFVADLSLGASLCLQGMWSLQTGISLHVDSFIPLGCHKLLDVVTGVEGSTRCDLDDSRLRAVAVLDLLFAVHVVVVVVLVMIVYAVAASTMTGGGNTVTRRFGSYEALPTATVASAVGSPSSLSGNNVVVGGGGDSSHIQMKALAGTQA